MMKEENMSLYGETCCCQVLYSMSTALLKSFRSMKKLHRKWGYNKLGLTVILHFYGMHTNRQQGHTTFSGKEPQSCKYHRK